MSTFSTQLVLGERYRDTNTGFEGKCVSISFFEHGCERCGIRGMNKQGDIVEYAFDAPEVELCATNVPVQVIEAKTGGPHDLAPIQRR